MRRIKKICNQHGFSLVELLVAIAIFSVVMTVVFSFMRTVTIQYGKGNNEINIQNEVQTLTAHLQDFIVEANASVGVDNSNGDIKLFMILDKEGTANDTFQVIEYDHVRGCLYYYSSDVFSGAAYTDKMNAFRNENAKVEKFEKAKAVVAAGPIANDASKVQNYLLTEDVTYFSVDTRNISDDYIVIGVTITKNNSHYTAAKNIFLRNGLYDLSSNGAKTTTTGDLYTASKEGGSESEGGGSGNSEGGNSGGGNPTSETTASSGDETEAEGGNTSPELTKVEITSCTISKLYEGENLSPANVRVTATYSNGDTVENVMPGSIGSSYKQDGKYYFKVNYQGVVSDNYYGIDYPTAIGAIASLSDPSKVYYQGDTLSSSDFIVQYVYSDNNKRNASFGFNSASNILNNIGDNTVSLRTSSGGMGEQYTVTCTVTAQKAPEYIKVAKGETYTIDVTGKKSITVYFNQGPGNSGFNVNGSTDGNNYSVYLTHFDNRLTQSISFSQSLKSIRFDAAQQDYYISSYVLEDDPNYNAGSDEPGGGSDEPSGAVSIDINDASKKIGNYFVFDVNGKAKVTIEFSYVKQWDNVTVEYQYNNNGQLQWQYHSNPQQTAAGSATNNPFKMVVTTPASCVAFRVDLSGGRVLSSITVEYE